jgi:large subunit ribosomal protein L19e
LNLRSKRRLAASVMGVGSDRVIFDEEYADLIQDAITRSTIRGLIGIGAISARPEKGISSGRARERSRKLKRGRGPGTYKGAKGARIQRKEKWILKVRALRWRLKVARERNELTAPQYWSLYKQVKGGQVRGVKHLTELMGEMKK